MREISWFGIFLAGTLGLAHAFLEGTELLREAPLLVACLAVALSTAATVLVTWSANRAGAKAHAQAALAQENHDARMRLQFPDQFDGHAR